jgi:transketolase
MLQAESIYVRVLDLFSVKPLDAENIIKNGHECKNNILTVEDHYPEGGIYEAVAGVVVAKGIQVHRLSVERVPGSAKPEEQLEMHGIDRRSVYKKVKDILGLH